MVHYLNVCDVSGSDVEPVDIITFGSPCQDLSIAGKQKGLSGNRSGLFMEAIRIIKEMRESTGGEYPKYALWENVPGAFSSNKGEDFRTVIEELCRICDETVSIPRPTKQKWRTAGTVVGDGWSVAWRVLDAKYHGVPQRRRRIFLVTDFTGECAAEILFKQESLSGNSEEGFGSREGTTGCITKSAGETIYPNEQCGSLNSVKSVYENQCGEVRLNEYTTSITCGGGKPGQGYQCVIINNAENDDISNEMTSSRVAAFMGGQGSNAGSIAYSEEVSPTIRSQAGGNSIPMAMTNSATYCIQGNCIDRADTAGCNGKGWKEEESYTLNTIDRHAVCAGFCPEQSKKTSCRIKIEEDGTTQTLTARMGTGGMNTALVMELTECDQRKTLSGKNVFGTLCANIGTKQWLGNQEAFSGDFYIKDASSLCDENYSVRRITPTECQRLQGFPENWAHINEISDMTDEDYNFWADVRKEYAKVNEKKFTDKSKEQTIKWYNKLHTDSSEYKMWGNGVALPCVLVPISEMAKRGCKTLGSLFDGSGGFPLAGVICGIKPLWCSEIEPYPIAVTKSRFG